MANKTTVTAEPGKQELFINREFDAPRDLVFRAHTDPELYSQWVGPRNLTGKIEKFALGSGQVWREIYSDASGNEFAFNGVCHYMSAPEKIIRTFEFEGLPERGHVALETAVFEELPDGRTKLTIQSVFQSIAERDGMVQSGMEMGVNESHERLDELLTKETAAAAKA